MPGLLLDPIALTLALALSLVFFLVLVLGLGLVLVLIAIAIAIALALNSIALNPPLIIVIAHLLARPPIPVLVPLVQDNCLCILAAVVVVIHNLIGRPKRAATVCKRL